MLIVLLKNIKFATRKAAYVAEPARERARKMESEESRIRFFTMIKSYLNVSQVYDNVSPALPKFSRRSRERKGECHLSGNEMA